MAVASVAATKAWPAVAAWARRTGPGDASRRSNGSVPIASCRTRFSSRPTSIPFPNNTKRPGSPNQACTKQLGGSCTAPFQL